MNKLVSIIIPVYNAQGSIQHCLTSILNQTYDNIEVILVNDGSTDKSGELCDSYKIKDSRIKVIHQENLGPSAARNAGIAISTGEFIQFVDSDDMIEPHMTENLVQAMVDTQLVICGYHSIYEAEPYSNATTHTPTIEGIFKYKDFIKHLGRLYKEIIFPSPCNKLYTARIIKKFNIQFQNHLKTGEDLLFNLDYLKHCDAVHLLTVPLYNYRVTSKDSLSRGYQKDFYHNQKMLYQTVKNYLIQENSYSGDNKLHLHSIYTNSVVNVFSNYFHPHSNLSKFEVKKNMKQVLNDHYTKENSAYFTDSLQKRIIHFFMKLHSINGIYLFFKFKSLMQYKMNWLFHKLKKLTKS